jgi:hypothetical protein
LHDLNTSDRHFIMQLAANRKSSWALAILQIIDQATGLAIGKNAHHSGL